ncbi:hypothetical protein BATDEDRAFT_88301 [Batrachochytrium dendrobatidis JAM81]|uniref:Uncharacterized protein n=1 Tax=Batrachochytrium dendrobatidis (strain JAM81 / FGSC 10211) TaxID=684364 RepID=F4P2G9_BATDJ|nr:uncharacterized protein BATDEDRAFT_88301 [Batrachochytrium dendrobatidis JAM81]EGF80568.1 hypothetical protein BATDEDRAFT_88301 [Batrachochytrium dendrobatidis JAM81]|eukprot:XP_006678619.1 hypothetical protein BATDEDRAFT_88301 [Batrachochytrium dendrobatidis JAM81]
MYTHVQYQSHATSVTIGQNISNFGIMSNTSVSVLVKIFDIKHAKTTLSDMHLVVMIHIDILPQRRRNHIHNT